MLQCVTIAMFVISSCNCDEGTTSQSCNIRLLLASMCWQIASVYQRDTASLPTDYPSLVAHFHSLLTVSVAIFCYLAVLCSQQRGYLG